MRPEQLRLLRILWAAISGSTVVFLVVLLVIRVQAPPTFEPDPLMLVVVGFTALAEAVMSVIMPKRMFAQTVRARKFEVVARAADERMFDDSGRRARAFADPAKSTQAAVPAYQTAMIIGLALAEAVALSGFALAQLGSPLLAVVPFFVVAGGLMATKFPSEPALVRSLEQAYDADLVGDEARPGRAASGE